VLARHDIDLDVAEHPPAVAAVRGQPVPRAIRTAAGDVVFGVSVRRSPGERRDTDFGLRDKLPVERPHFVIT